MNLNGCEILLKSRFGKSLRDPKIKAPKTFVPGPGYYEKKDKIGDGAPKVIKIFSLLVYI